MNILIAEDDVLTLEALASCIESDGFTALQARDGRQAIELWRTKKPDLVCLDIMMPKMNGYDVCRRIRAADVHLPIFFLSAKSEEADVVAGLNLGADDFIRKPFTRLEVMARIRSALRRVVKQSSDSGFIFGDLTISAASLSANRGDDVIDLTPREISILRMLYQQKGKAVSRDALLDYCWGVDYFPNSRTLDQHILLLRKKIERSPSSPSLMQTVRAIGYSHG